MAPRIPERLLTDTQLRASPVPVTDVGGGSNPSPTFDSGLVPLTDTLAALTADAIEVARVILCNLTTSAQTVTITNTAGGFYLKDFPLQGRMTVALDFGRALVNGVKWKAGANASVNAQLVGEVTP